MLHIRVLYMLELLVEVREFFPELSLSLYYSVSAPPYHRQQALAFYLIGNHGFLIVEHAKSCSRWSCGKPYCFWFCQDDFQLLQQLKALHSMIQKLAPEITSLDSSAASASVSIQSWVKVVEKACTSFFQVNVIMLLL